VNRAGVTQDLCQGPSPEKKEESDAYDEDSGNYGNAVLSTALACGNIDET
jgi:hypothetical protein